MSDVPWTDPKFDLTDENRRKLRLALERGHRRAPGRSQSDLHEHGTVSEGVAYGRPVPPTAREDWHAQQREEALAEQAGHDQETGHSQSTLHNIDRERFLRPYETPRDEWHREQRRDVRAEEFDASPAGVAYQNRQERGSTQRPPPGPYFRTPPTQTREDWHANQRRLLDSLAEGRQRGANQHREYIRRLVTADEPERRPTMQGRRARRRGR